MTEFISLDGTPLTLSGTPPCVGEPVRIGQIDNAGATSVLYSGPSFEHWPHQAALRFAIRIGTLPSPVSLQVTSGDRREILKSWAEIAQWRVFPTDPPALAAAGLWLVQVQLPARALLVLDGDARLLYGEVPPSLDREVDFDAALARMERVQ
jgi:hypothetical protein